MKLLYASLLVLSLTGIAFARAPENADPELAPWFQSLHNKNLASENVPDGPSCCGLGDGHMLTNNEWRLNKDGRYEVLVKAPDPHWAEIADNQVIQKESNPTGVAVVFYHPEYGMVYCFVPPPGY